MSWTAPRTWVTSEVVTAANMNSAVRDNLRYLKGLDGAITIEDDIITSNNVDGVDVSSHESRHVSGGADDIDSALALAAMPDLTVDKVWRGTVINRPTEVDFPTRTLSAANDTVQEGYYAGTTLSAVDTDLAAGNIKKSTNIFGFVGTLEGRTEEATAAMFQTYAAIGTADFPYQINDNDFGTDGVFDVTDEYAEVPYGRLVKIKRWRQYGDIGNNGDGVWKIQYWNITDLAWTDWVTGIATRTTANWSTLSTEAEVVTTRIRLIATTIDSGATDSRMTELEVIF